MIGRVVAFAVLLAPSFAQSPGQLIGSIDFFGYGTLPVESIRKVLPFHEGDRMPSAAVNKEIEQAIEKLAGRPAVISSVCCDSNRRRMVFVGLSDGTPPIRFHPEPTAVVRLPDEALEIFRQLDEHQRAAIYRGVSGEDQSHGYPLSDDPVTREDQLKLREWARGNVEITLRVLSQGRSARHRTYAARTLGFADRSPGQIAGLVEGAFDAVESVRDEAVRSLWVLCQGGKEVSGQIPTDRFIPFLHSISWTDRNKASSLLARITESRNPALLKLLHDQALTPLREMAQWKDFLHGLVALEMLARIAGWPEDRVADLDQSMTAEVLSAVK